MKTALTIAGSDSSGGAGIQADIKTMTAHGVYAMSAITALTAQNTTGVYGILNVEPEFFSSQLDCIFTDIFPDAVKIGMLSNKKIMEITAQKLRQYGAKHIVLDPVMVSTSGSKLMRDDASKTLKSELFPLAELITPNVPEAEVLCGMEIHTKGDMEGAAKYLFDKFGCNALLKGGHSINDANDLLVTQNGILWIEGRRIDNPNTHGTGCTLSSAIASNLALGYDIVQSVKNAKAYISGALASGLDLGHGSGPLNHTFAIKRSDIYENNTALA